MLYLILVLFIVWLLGSELRWKIQALRSPLRTIPGPWYAPFTSIHLRYFFSTGEIWKYVEKSHGKYGSIVRLGPRQVWVSDKDSLRQILQGIDLPKVRMYAEISRDRNSPGLFGEVRLHPHKQLKRFLSPAFTVSYVDNLEDIFKGVIQDLLKTYSMQASQRRLTAGAPLETDLMDNFHKAALDIISECSFGKGLDQVKPEQPMGGTSDDKAWESMPSAIFKGQATRYRNVYIKRLLRSIGLDVNFDWPAELVAAIDSIVQHRLRSTDVPRPDLLQHLLNSEKLPSTGDPMSSRVILDQLSEIVLAGSETTSGTIACLFVELARNPDVRSKLLASLPKKSHLDVEDVVTSRFIRNNPEYEYLEACIKENLRLHPIASEMGRRTGSEWVTLAGHHLPPHTVVSASYRDLHRNEEFWPNSLRFIPERWLSEEKRGGVAAADSTAYFPFSAGKHSCIGINFAWAEMRMIAANVLSRYDVREVSDQEVDFRQFITMQFDTGRWRVLLYPRHES